MASIIIGSIPAHGHITPLLTVAQRLVARGDDVRFVTGSRYADKVTATGATFISLPAEADFDIENLLHSFPERAELKGLKAVAFDLENVLAGPVGAQYQTLLAMAATDSVDMVLAEPLFVGASFMLGHRRPLRPAVVMCSVLPLPIDSPDTAPFGMGLQPARFLNRQRNAALTALNRRVMKRAHQIISDQHREVHGTDMPGTITDWGRRADAIVQFSVPSFEYPRSDLPANVHYVGPVAAGGFDTPLPDWWGDLDGTRPVVHVTQGTVANLDYDQAIAPTLRALADEDVLVVVATGGRPVDTLPPLPANTRAAQYLPYDELLPRTAVYVTNGGYGGVQYALRYGVPIVATGGKEDKPEVGARVAWTGVGRRMRTEKPSPHALRRNILAVLKDPRYREASRRVAADIGAASGFAGVTEVIDGLITEGDPARPPTPLDSQPTSA